MDDWKSKLSNLLASNPDLPDGEDIIISNEDDSKTKKKNRLDITLDRKRAGKTASIISGFSDDDDIKNIAAQLKQKLGVGGSARGGEILIQGDRRNDIAKILSDIGYKSRVI